MKIPVTQTELRAMPHVAWRKCWDFLLGSDAELTPIQQSAAVCLWYYIKAQDGFEAFFGNYPQLDRRILADALTEIGATDFAENFQNAAENSAQADTWFAENCGCLVDIIYDFHLQHEYEFYEIVDEDYTLCPPGGLFLVGAIEVALMWGMAIVFSVLNPDDWPLIAITFFIISSLGLFLMGYAKLWRATVKKDVLTIHAPLRRVRTIRITDISEVRKRRDNIAIYTHGRKTKAAAIEHAVSNFAFLYAQLALAGKIREKQFSSIFEIRQDKVKLAEAVLLFGCAVGAFVWAMTFPVSIYEQLFFALALLWTGYNLIDKLMWRISVSGSHITIKRPFRSEWTFPIRDLTMIKVSDKDMALYIGKKKAATVRFAAKNSDSLELVLRNEKAPFMKNGKRV